MNKNNNIPINQSIPIMMIWDEMFCVVEGQRKNKKKWNRVASDPLGVYLFHTHSPKTLGKMQEYSDQSMDDPSSHIQ